ncbi:MAG: TenA family protein [Firmicutes bacterium]|nr:TenA family protein [Bacillota bacterium]
MATADHDSSASSLSLRLWRENEEEAQQALHHPFVEALARATLPKERFTAFLAQDALYLDAYARAYALGAAKAPDAEAMRSFARLLDGTLQELADVHQSYARRWGIRLATVPDAVTQAYTDFLLHIGYARDAGSLAVAMTPCSRLYAFLGASLAPQVTPDHPYAAWVQAYASPDFEASAVQLEHLVDRLAADTPTTHHLYRHALTLELAFFDQAPL